jgi:tRNA(fMet)-specific endonuclease VapC
MLYLLDANIISDLIRNPQGRITDRIRKVGEEKIGTSIIVAAELRFGAAGKGSPRLTGRVEEILASIFAPEH